jgi:ribosomal protein S18 acetylase RimI-like enzyme
VNDSTYEQLLEHLLACSDDFVPPLHTYVDVADYADRLARRALRLERFDEEAGSVRLVALLALYADDAAGTAFVTNVSVLPDARRHGLGDGLVDELLDVARGRGLLRVRLEVDQGNIAAQRLYLRHGFAASGRTSVDRAPGRIEFERTLVED